MSILLISFCIILLVISLVTYYRFTLLKTQLDYVLNNNSELYKTNQELNKEKIQYIKEIEQLKVRNEYFNAILEESNKLKKDSSDFTKAALLELGEKLYNQLIESHKKESKEVRELSEKKIFETTSKFNLEFERLINIIGALSKEVEQSKESVDVIKRSLLSPSGAGALSEITLENILKSSGLKVNVDFIMQYNFSASDINRLRPDAIVFLPGNNIMVIDAKASKFLLEDLKIDKLSKTMNNHLKSLTNKDYAENIYSNFKDQSVNNIVTLMFLPTEHAIEKVIESDENFMNKAWAVNIFPVGPAGLVNMLSFAKFQISSSLQSENQKLILDEIRKLLNSIMIMVEHSQKIGSNIQSLASNYDKFAASFNKGFLSKVKNIQDLGINTGKKITPQLLQRYQVFHSQVELVENYPNESAKEVNKINN